jgi:hypothetical protein
MPGGDGEAADIVRKHSFGATKSASASWRGLRGRPRLLLAQRVQVASSRVRALVGPDLDVVAVGVGRPEADDGAAVNQFSSTICSSMACASAKSVARRLADLRVVEDRRVAALHLPGLEERRPVDVGTSSARS